MTSTELRELINSIDPTNLEYIFADYYIQGRFSSYNAWLEQDDERALQIAASVLKTLIDAIKNYDNIHLTPANVKVGQGATVNYWSDRHAGTIVPEWIPGGFSGYCTNAEQQSYTYEKNPDGELITLRWSKRYNQYGQPGDLTASKGRHEYYDYNF